MVSLCLLDKPHQLQQFHGARPRLFLLPPGNFQRIAHIAQHIALKKQVITLKNHADPLPHLQQFPAGKAGEILTVHDHLTGVRALQEVDAPHQRAFPRPGQPNNAENLAVIYRKADIRERRHGRAACVKGLTKVPYLDHMPIFSFKKRGAPRGAPRLFFGRASHYDNDKRVHISVHIMQAIIILRFVFIPIFPRFQKEYASL